MTRAPTVWEETAALLEGVSVLPEDYGAVLKLARSLPPDTGAMLEGFINPRFMKMSLAAVKIFGDIGQSVSDSRACSEPSTSRRRSCLRWMWRRCARRRRESSP